MARAGRRACDARARTRRAAHAAGTRGRGIARQRGRQRWLKEAAELSAAEVGRVRAEFDELVRRLNAEREQCKRVRGELRAAQDDRGATMSERGDLRAQLDEAVAARERLERELGAATSDNRWLAAHISG